MNPQTVLMLERVCAVITTHTSQFEMENWFKRKERQPENPVNDCGTVACIAGWIVSLQYPQGMPVLPQHANISNTWQTGMFVPTPGQLLDEKSASVPALAAQVLGLDTEICRRLFYISSWPSSYRMSYWHADTPEAKAVVAVARIHHFIATGL